MTTMTTTVNNTIPKSGIELIKRFEGCKLTSYPDPKTGGAPWTIGWGNTKGADGKPIQPGTTITAAQADTLLVDSLAREFWPAVQKLPYFADMTDEQRGALLSFTFNLGAGFYGSNGFTTISRYLKSKDWDRVPEALVLYRNPGSNVEEGLKRRRVAEGALWSSGLQKFKNSKRLIIAKQDTLLKKEPLQSFELSETAKVTVPRGRSYTIVDSLVEGSHTRVTLDHSAGVWYVYNPHWEIKVPGTAEVSDDKLIVLNVPYYTQLDSTTAHGQRMCFSSVCAMAAEFLKPGCLGGGRNADDLYLNKYVFKYGDTTSSVAQVRALRDLGITAVFRQNLGRQNVIDQLRRGIPVPAGYLHKGPVGRPTGGGHYCLIIGIDLNTKQYIVQDPWGEADLVGGGFNGSMNGSRVRYSFKNFEARWCVEGDKTGWGLMLTR
jgi:GH24 family phage-related lysozyme (muramidase)